MIEAICKVNDKFNQYPPTKNRTAGFRMVFEEKLKESRADILAFKAKKDHLGEKASYIRKVLKLIIHNWGGN